MAIPQAIIELTDGTTTVSLINGPFYLSEWLPSISQYKQGGTFVDSPVLDGRFISAKARTNVTERIDFMHRGHNTDFVARDMGTLTYLLEKASDYWAKRNVSNPVYLKVRAHGETNIRYAVVIYGTLAGAANQFSSPFLQPGDHRVQDSLSLIIERQEWTSTPPGKSLPLAVEQVDPTFNLLQMPSFENAPLNVELPTGIPDFWTASGSPTSLKVVDTRAYTGQNSLYIATPQPSTGIRGVYQEIEYLTPGTEYTISARYLVESGVGFLGAYDGGGFTNGVTATTIQRGVEQLSNTGFEASTTPWRMTLFGGRPLSYYERSSAQAYAGTYSLKFHNEVQSFLESGFAYDAENDAITLTKQNPVYNPEFLGGGGGGSYLLPQIVSEWIDLDGYLKADVSFAVYVDFLNYPNIMDETIWVEGVVQWGRYDVVESETVLFRTSKAAQAWMVTDKTAEWDPFGGTPNPLQARLAFKIYAENFLNIGSLGTIYIDQASFKLNLGRQSPSEVWEQLSVQKTAPAGGVIRVFTGCDATIGGTMFVDEVQLNRTYGDPSRTLNGAYVGNYLSYLNLNWISYDDGGTFSDNLMDSDFDYELFPSTLATSDALYFGIGCMSDTVSRDETPFSNILFNIASAAQASALVCAWEYYNGSSWSALTVVDETAAFTVSGQQLVSWSMPEDWEPNAPDASLPRGYWVRARFTTVTSLTAGPVVDSFHPFSVSKPYLEVPGSALKGDYPAISAFNLFPEVNPTVGRSNFGITTGNDDAYYWNNGTNTGSASDADVAWTIDKDLAVRFQGLTIPTGSKIFRAFLYAVPSSVTASSGSLLRYQIYGEDADDSAAFDTSSAANLYTDLSGRTRTTAAAEAAISANYWNDNAGRWAQIPGPVEGIIQEIVDRAGWASGNDITFFIESFVDYGTTTLGMRMDDSGSSPAGFLLEIEYITADSGINTIIVGSRSVSRGSNFQSHINFVRKDYQPPNISVETGQRAAFIEYDDSQAGYYNYLTITYGGQVCIVTNPYLDGEEPVDRITARIKYPLSAEYTGSFRAFCRCALDGVGPPTGVGIRMRYSFGSGGGSAYGEISYCTTAFPQLIDLGSVMIPDEVPDNISISIQVGAASTGDVYLLDLILIPVDEWSGTFTSLSGTPYSTIDNEKYAVLSSVDSIKNPVQAYIADQRTNKMVAAMSGPSSRIELSTGDTQRIYFLFGSNSSLDAVNPAATSISYQASVVRVTGRVIHRYSLIRGAR